MYTRQESSIMKQEFWTAFGQYMRPVASAAGATINWVNYKTGVQNIFFRMDADKETAMIAVELRHPNQADQESYFLRLKSQEELLHETTGTGWKWDLVYYNDHGKRLARISKTLTGVNLFRKEDWPAIISFLKNGITGLDKFWVEMKDMMQ